MVCVACAVPAELQPMPIRSAASSITVVTRNLTSFVIVLLALPLMVSLSDFSALTELTECLLLTRSADSVVFVCNTWFAHVHQCSNIARHATQMLLRTLRQPSM